MIPLWLSLALWTADPLAVEVSTLDGRSVAGRMESLAADALVVNRDGKSVRIPTAELLEVRNTAPAPPVTSGDGQQIVTLQDGSRFRCRSLAVSGQSLTVEHGDWGALTIPVAQVHSLQLADDAALSAAWKQLVERPAKKDLVVVRKGDVLDHLDGVVGAIDENTVNFLLDGDQISIKRERIYGIIYSKKDAPAAKQSLRVEFSGGDALNVRQIAWNGDKWQVSLGGSQQFAVPATSVQRLDYSQGKVLYLSAMEPRDVKYTPYYDFVFEYQRDRHLFGGPLRIGGRTYARGLAIHSKTLLKYRLGGEYRRFTAVLGMDPEIKFPALARVEIRGDGRVLFSQDVKSRETPQNLDLAVDGVGELEILVDYGDNSDVGDRIHLGEAKVIK